jgi:hypothetical protein
MTSTVDINQQLRERIDLADTDRPSSVERVWTRAVHALDEAQSKQSPTEDRRRRLISRRVVIGTIALALTTVSVAAASQLGVFDGSPAPADVKAAIARQAQGAPLALDPGINADATVDKLTLNVPEGTVVLDVTSALQSAYSVCMGIRFSWAGPGATMGCIGRDARPISNSIVIPGVLGHSPQYAYGYVNSDSATALRIDFASGTSETTPLQDGFYLLRFEADQVPTRETALDSSGGEVASMPFDSAPFAGMQP